MKSMDPDLQGKELQLTHSAMSSKHEMTALVKTNSQDQCATSGYVHDERYGREMQAQNKSATFFRNPEYSTSSLQIEVAHSTGFSPVGYSDPYMSGLYAAYGPQAFPQMMGIVPARVPLPLEVAEDGPIYVNAKQYNGILRRRQIRAKLEAQNKLVKNRKPYLHESRHLHAVNRVRGTGGRFLSTKKVHHSDPNTPSNSTSSRDSVEREGSTSAFSSVRQDVHKGISFQQPDRRAFNVSSHMDVTMQDRSGFSCNGTQQHAPVVR